MYIYDFDNEEVIIESVDNLITIKDKEIKSNILLTEKNLLIFKNIKNDSALAGRELYEMPEYELIIKIDLNKIKYSVEENNTYIKIGNEEIILYDFDLNRAKNN